MPQVFHPSMNTIARATIVGLVVAAAGVAGVLYLFFRSSYATGADTPRMQPVQFSHEHHVGQFGIDCRYCHTSVETSAFAGLPPTKTCMNCHSQIWVGSPMLEPVRESYRTGTPLAWERVHNLPEFSYFDHSIHVAKGIGCVTCHGQVDRMPLLMQTSSLLMEWCLECHRQPERYVRPRDEVFNVNWKPPENQEELGRKLVKEYGIQSLTSCSTCHR